MKNYSSYFQLNINYSGERFMSNPPISGHNEPKREKERKKIKKSISIRQACSHLSQTKFDGKDNT